MREYEKQKQQWLEEEHKPFYGWDFSYINDRWQSEPLAWDYRFVVTQHLRPADYLLDMGTGGGEFLLSLEHPHQLTSVTESWLQNLELCRRKLAPLGIMVYPVEVDARLPIADSRFDLVINRHESYDLNEVRRILKPNGFFITQQVGGCNCSSFRRRINPKGTPSSAHFSLKTELPKFREAGFTVARADECFPELRFLDIGALVYWAKNIVWSYPDFSVERNFERLCRLQQEVEQNGFVSDREHRFLIVAQNIK